MCSVYRQPRETWINSEAEFHEPADQQRSRKSSQI